MKLDERDRRIAAAMFAVAALAARLVGIGSPGFTPAEVHRLTFGGGGLFAYFSASSEPPIYPLFLALWSAFFDAEWWVRLPSALFSAAAVGVSFLLIERKITAVTATLACVLLTLHPMSVEAAQQASPVALATLFVALSAYFASAWLATHGERAKLPTVIFAALALYTHTFAWFYVAWLGFAMFSSSIKPGFRFRDAFAPVAGAVLLGLPWLPVMVRQAAHGMATIPREDLTAFAARLCANYPFGVDTWHIPTFSGLWHFAGVGDAALVVALFAIFAFVAVLGFWGGFRHPFLGALFAVPVVLAFVARIFVPVSLVDMTIVAPAAIGCVASGIGELSRRSRFGAALAAIIAVVLVLLAAGAVNDVHRNRRYNPADWREIHARVGDPRPREWVMAYSAESAAPFEYYSRGRWQFKPLAATDAEALRMGSRGLAAKALSFAPLAFRVTLIDHDGERFDPDAEVVKTLAATLGRPTFQTVAGYPTYTIVSFPDRRAFEPLKLFWLLKW